jgi:O-6-methylguanine DNA methyltransferase
VKLIKNVLTSTKHADFPLVRFCVTEVKGIGPMMLAATDEGLCWTGMTTSLARLKKQFPRSVLMRDDKLAKLGREIADVHAGKRKALSVPVVLTGTGFQMLVWSELLKIKRGKTLTYQDIAEKIGKPAASRAVGTAVGANPVTLLVPCHRVLAKAKGAKLKFGWGPEAKALLLKLEGVAV